jgi:DNA repair protein RecN (Recombination protein N)
LAGLGFAKELRVLFEFGEHEIYRSFDNARGFHEERARLLWAPNPGQPPQPLDKIASGGELSRFLLAVIGLLSEAEQPTLIFDEVDAGIGGLTLTRVGERIKALSTKSQIILITHWPQLAALAERHFQIRKEVRDAQTHTLCQKLDKPAVRRELSRMAGGGGQGDALVQGLLGEE